MNLTTDKWIPVVRTNGQADTVNLEQVFSEGGDIRDLAVRPHERIALMRLLLGITHAGLHPEKGGGPLNDKDWRDCRNTLAEAALQHLANHRNTFDFSGNGPLFGQLYTGTKLAPAPDPKDPTWASKLDLTLATGNNPTVFDNAAINLRSFALPDLALMLLAYQVCSPLIGRGYKGRSPCVEGNMLHTLLRGATLLDTIWLNLLDRAFVEDHYGSNAWGVPVWLAMPHSPSDKANLLNATETYLGRLVPLPRSICFADDRRTIALENGLEYPAWDGDPAEPTSTVVVKDKKERKVLRADLNRAVWRDLPSLAVKRRSDGSRSALAWQRFPEDQVCDFWVGALVTDNKAKVLNMVESVFVLPANAGSEDFLRFYEGGVQFAQGWASAVERGLSAYRLALGDNIDRRQSRKRGTQTRLRAASHFWTAIETAVREVLIPLAAAPPDDLKCEQPYCLDYSRSDSRWGPLVRRAAEDAFALACPQASARQAAAFGAGRRAMLNKQPRPNLNPRAAVPEPSTTETKEL
jgi:CRISPR system Cascade subunit CasA